MLGLLLAPASVWAQRVVVLCLHPQSQPNSVLSMVRETRDLQGAQALVLSRVASSPWQRSRMLPHEQWERSAYLTLNAGARALAPSSDDMPAQQRLKLLHEMNGRWGYPVVIGLLPEELQARGVQMRYLTIHRDSPVLLAGAPFPEPETRLVKDFHSMLDEAGSFIKENPRLMLWIDARTLSAEQRWQLIVALRRSLRLPADRIYLLLPVPSLQEASDGARMGWVMALGREEQGLMVSRSTRLPGYITLPDLTATWLSHFGYTSSPGGLIGSSVQSLPDEEASQALERLHASLVRQVKWNRTVGALPTVQLLALVLAWFVWYRFGRVLRALWLLPCLVPVLGVSLAPVLICLPLGGIPMGARAGIWALALLALAIGLSRLPLSRSLRGLAVVLLVFVGVDLLRGGNLLRWSGYGYVLQEGARFYGIGNEMAGSLIGAQAGYLLSEGAGWSLLRWLMTAVAIGAPFWGANFGGMLSALTVAGVQGVRSRRMLWWSFALAVILLAGLLVWERVSPDPSHLGAFLQTPATWLSTAGRKVQMNLALLTHSAWTPLLLFGLLGLRGAPIAVWAGALALLLLNDSGVVASAAMLTWWWAWKMSLLEGDKRCCGLARESV